MLLIVTQAVSRRLSNGAINRWSDQSDIVWIDARLLGNLLLLDMLLNSLLPQVTFMSNQEIKNGKQGLTFPAVPVGGFPTGFIPQAFVYSSSLRCSPSCCY